MITYEANIRDAFQEDMQVTVLEAPGYNSGVETMIGRSPPGGN